MHYAESFGDGDIEQSCFCWIFSNKWMGADGADQVLVFSGVSDNDSWNTVEASWTVLDAPPLPGDSGDDGDGTAADDSSVPDSGPGTDAGPGGGAGDTATAGPATAGPATGTGSGSAGAGGGAPTGVLAQRAIPSAPHGC